MKDKQGRTIQSEEEQKNRWKEHFEKLLGQPPIIDDQPVEVVFDSLPIEINDTTEEELLKLKDETICWSELDWLAKFKPQQQKKEEPWKDCKLLGSKLDTTQGPRYRGG